MGQFFYNYGTFLAEVITTVVAIMILVAFIISVASKDKNKERLTIKKLNDKYNEMRDVLNKEILEKRQLKLLAKQEKEKKKLEKKVPTTISKKRVFVINFKGDLRASTVDNLREEITAILNVATPQDEVVARIESAGGMIQSYGLAASELRRIRDHKIPLTAIVDKVAASGGYLMACVADKILAAPFAIVGSIGVLAQIPNFHRLLKKHEIDFEQITAGEYKRTLSMLGENTTKGRKKFQEEIDEAHSLFKNFVLQNRTNLNIDEVATGEHWFGAQAIALGLIDNISTSDDYLLNASNTANVFEISYTIRKRWDAKLAHVMKSGIDNIFFRTRGVLQQ